MAWDLSKKPDTQREGDATDSLTTLPVTSLVPNPYQPRIKFDENKLKELSETIQKQGMIQPIVARKNAGRYEIVSGERRWQASKLAKLETVPVIIRNIDDRMMLEWALIENMEREDLNPIEIAKAVRALQDRFHLTQDEVADKLSKDRSTISNLCRLLTLPEPVQQMLIDGQIELGHAKVILSIPNELKRMELARQISEGGWSVRRTEQEAKRILAELNGTTYDASSALNEYGALEQEFSRHLGTPARLKIKKSGESYRGVMEIQIQSKDDLNRILGIVRKGVVENRLSGVL